jgi:WhiB family redox-sensing transcriptional regulator
MCDHPERACRGFPASVFYPDGRGSGIYDIARQVCGSCPIQAMCLEWALETGQLFGMWGGRSPAQRSRMVGRTARETTRLQKAGQKLI